MAEKDAGKLTAPNCPQCGKFMDKVEVLVVENLQQGTVEVSKGGSDTYIGWVCSDEKCSKAKG